MSTIVIDERHVVAFVELQPPFVLARDMCAPLAAVAELDVIVDHSAVDDCALLLLSVRGAIPLAARYVVGHREKMKRLQRAKEFRREG